MCGRSKEGTITIPDFEKALERVYGEDWEEQPRAKGVYNSFLDFNAKAGRAVGGRRWAAGGRACRRLNTCRFLQTFSPHPGVALLSSSCVLCVQVDRDLLRIFIRSAPNLLFPAFGLQKQMQERIFG